MSSLSGVLDKVEVLFPFFFSIFIVFYAGPLPGRTDYGGAKLALKGGFNPPERRLFFRKICQKFVLKKQGSGCFCCRTKTQSVGRPEVNVVHLHTLSNLKLRRVTFLCFCKLNIFHFKMQANSVYFTNKFGANGSVVLSFIVIMEINYYPFSHLYHYPFLQLSIYGVYLSYYEGEMEIWNIGILELWMIGKYYFCYFCYFRLFCNLFVLYLQKNILIWLKIILMRRLTSTVF